MLFIQTASWSKDSFLSLFFHIYKKPQHFAGSWIVSFFCLLYKLCAFLFFPNRPAAAVGCPVHSSSYFLLFFIAVGRKKGIKYTHKNGETSVGRRQVEGKVISWWQIYFPPLFGVCACSVLSSSAAGCLIYIWRTRSAKGDSLMYVLENKRTSCLVYLRRGSDRVEQDSHEVGLES